jgi:hypothetical protein
LSGELAYLHEDAKVGLWHEAAVRSPHSQFRRRREKHLRRQDDSALPSLTKAEISTFYATPEAAAQA